VGQIEGTTMKYRQHKSNVSLAGQGFSLRKIFLRLFAIRELRRCFFTVTVFPAQVLCEKYGDRLTGKNGELLRAVATLDRDRFWVRKYKLIHYGIRRYNWIRNIGFWIFF